MSAWKSFEASVAKLFGGKRVPLSGSNSGHGTRSDVREIPFGSRFYIECKRDKTFLPSLVPYIPGMRKGTGFIFQATVGELILFDGLTLLKNLTIEQMIDVGPKKRHKSIGFFESETLKAKSEGRKVLVLAMRAPNKHGIFMLTELSNFVEVEQHILKVNV